MHVWVWDIVSVVGGVAALLVGGDYLVRGASQLARALGVSAMVVGLTIVAMGTSMPELVVSVDAALRETPDVTVGNAVGSNLFNLLPALGLVALFKPVVGQAAFLRREVPIMLAAMLLAWSFTLTGRLPRPLAGILLLVLVAYLFLAIRLARAERAAGVVQEFDAAIPDRRSPIIKDLLFMVGGFALMVGGADYFLDGSVGIARRLGYSELFIGLTLVAGGTSAPELFTCLIAVAKGEDDIALGNLIGSSIFNILGILGFAGLITDLPISRETIFRDMPLMMFGGLLAWLFIWTGSRVSRFEGALLVLLYVAYVALLLAQQAGALPALG